MDIGTYLLVLFNEQLMKLGGVPQIGGGTPQHTIAASLRKPASMRRTEDTASRQAATFSVVAEPLSQAVIDGS